MWARPPQQEGHCPPGDEALLNGLGFGQPRTKLTAVSLAK